MRRTPQDCQCARTLGVVVNAGAQAEISALDAETLPVPVYPNWFIDNLADQPVAQVLGKAASQNKNAGACNAGVGYFPVPRKIALSRTGSKPILPGWCG